MALPSDFIERVKDANRIDEVMRSYCSLKRASRGYVCLCPFHSEKTPSCHIHPDDGYFHCFGCGAGGDVITFTMKIENLSYIEAIRLLADKAGIPVPEGGVDDKVAEQKKRLLTINREAARFFYSNLKTPDGKEGLEYLINKRRLKVSTIKSFGLGVATKHPTALVNHMTALGYTHAELERASLISRNKQGRYFDFFINRIIFPIFDLRGNVIAFSGRTLDPDPKYAKYKNSAETLVYQKRKTLFALNFAKGSAVKTKRLILCEGNVDVISLHQAGFTEAVATCGTAITPEHARLMSQYCDEVYICYDADSAGQKATQTAIATLSAAGLSSKVIKVQGEGIKDVDDYIHKLGPVRFKNLMEGSQGALAFELDKCKTDLDLESDFGRVEYIKRAVKVLADIESRVEREIYISRVANDIGVKTDTLTAEVNAQIKKNGRAYEKKQWRQIAGSFGKRDELNPEANSYPKEAKAEEGILAYIFKHPDSVTTVLAAISPERFVTSFNRRVYEAIADKARAYEEVTLSSLGQEFSPDEMGKLTGILASTRDIVIDADTLREYIDVLKKHDVQAKSDGKDMTDDEFLAYVQKLSKEKN